MTGDLLDLARLESGHLAIDPAPTDLCTIIGHTVEATTAHDGPGTTFTVRIPTKPTPSS